MHTKGCIERMRWL